jgi:hypothetical protein
MRKRHPTTPGATRVVPAAVADAPEPIAPVRPLTVACVLRSGGLYDARWVQALKVQLERHLPPAPDQAAHRFVCLSDLPVAGVEVLLLRHDWPGWWAKIELFRFGLFDGPVLYLDLDTLAIGDLSDLGAWRGGFAALRNWNSPDGLGSGVMAWSPSPNTASIYERFAVDPQRVMDGWRDGDQAFIGDVLGTGPEIVRLQDLLPGQIASYKLDHCHTQAPAGTRLCVFHGKPKPHNCGGWAQAAWEAALRGAA